MTGCPSSHHAIFSAGLAVLLLLGPAPSWSAEAASLPPPARDEPAAAAGSETAVLAGGCFWGVQGVFQHVEGVERVVSGYAGGAADTARYETVSMGRSGHAEAVEIRFDPRMVSYGTLLRIFFAVAHDPTEIDRQGPDHGSQYRSAIFPRSAAQAAVARDYIAQLDAARAFARPIATRIEPDASFYPAEEYHQDFLVRNPRYPYVVLNDLPKLGALERQFPERYRAQPVLTSAGR